jgi:lipoprotein-anchoring transpeptidase ErfK/SrfK
MPRMKPTPTLALAAALALCLPSLAAAAEIDAEATNDSTTRDGVAGILRAQVLLERAHFSPGEIDGRMGSNTRRAIAGFQRLRGLPDSGELDEATWTALNADAGPALVAYTVTAADVAGPFQDIPRDMMAKAKLPALGYASAEEALAEKFHASPDLLRQLNTGAWDVAGTRIVVPNTAGLDAPAQAARVIVDKSDSTVALADAAGKVYAQYPATTGSSHDPLPIGEWKINGVARDPDFHYNPALFWDADPAHAKATVPAGPNNPVGVVWIDLSKEHYGIHGTPEPSTIGKTQSHGCIRLTNWSAREVAAAVAAGTPALLQE